MLVYAYDSTSPYHRASAQWWEDAVNGAEPIGLPWTVVLGFVRLVTSARVLTSPLSVDTALNTVNSWFSHPTVATIEPGPAHLEVFGRCLRYVGVGNKLVADAHLAAISLEYGATLASHDRDLSRFPEVSVVDPIQTNSK